MNTQNSLAAFIPFVLAAGAILCARADDDEGQDKAIAYPCCFKIFDGRSFEGWEADPSTWSIVDGAMRGVGGSSRLASTTAAHGSFRLIFTARMAPVNGDHLGVLFWGDRPNDPARPKSDNAVWCQVIPPCGASGSEPTPKHPDPQLETIP